MSRAIARQVFCELFRKILKLTGFISDNLSQIKRAPTKAELLWETDIARDLRALGADAVRIETDKE